MLFFLYEAKGGVIMSTDMVVVIFCVDSVAHEAMSLIKEKNEDGTKRTGNTKRVANLRTHSLLDNR